MMLKKWIVLGITILALTSCVMGPAYKQPTVTVPDHYKISNYHAKKNLTHHYIQSHEQWWESFHDRTLNLLIERATYSSLDVKMAMARIEEARAQYNVNTSQFFPVLRAEAMPPNGTGDNNLTQVLGLFLSWVPDLFGRIKSGQNASKANLEAAIADHNFAVLNMSAEVANTYWELRGSQIINKILLKYLTADKSIYQSLHSNYRSGKDNYINVVQQDSLLETEKAELSQNAAKISALISKLEILLGENPGILTSLLSKSSDLSSVNTEINLGVPSNLLRRRPDIIAAERKVAATHANINAAIGELFPNISVGWLLAWQSQTLAANIFSLKNSEQHYFGTFSAPLVNLTLYKIVDLRKRQKAIAVIQYELTVLRALHDVTINYDNYQRNKTSTLHYSRALDDKKLAVKLLKNLYSNDALDFNTLLQSEKDLHKLEIRHVESNIASHIALVNLYKSLGGNVD